MKIAKLLFSIAALLACAAWGQPSNVPATAAAPAVPADNTKSNSEDPSNRARTADDQKNNMSDLKITQQIRRDVMADKNLSTYAQNAKIVSVNGTVTLNGVVHSESERDQVARIAAGVAGKAHVINEIKVEPK
jgi:osmotically-inducible protein OsmY